MRLVLVTVLVSACGSSSGGHPDAHVPESDAGVADAGEPDAGEPDAGEPDAGQPDAAEARFVVAGTVTGLEGQGLVLQNGGGDDLAIEADGPFVFPTGLGQGEPYDVTVAVQPADPEQACTVEGGSGVIDGSDVTDVAVSCERVSFTLGGHVFGLEGTGLTLATAAGDSLVIDANGPFVFGDAVPVGSAYEVSIGAQPEGPAQECVLYGAAGVADADIRHIVVDCGESEVARLAIVARTPGQRRLLLGRVFPGGVVPPAEDVTSAAFAQFAFRLTPDARQLFVNPRPSTTDPAPLEVVDAATVGAQPVRLSAEVSVGQTVHGFAFSPDLDHVYFVDHPFEGQRGLYAAPLDSPASQRTIELFSDATAVVLDEIVVSPSGDVILFRAGKNAVPASWDLFAVERTALGFTVAAQVSPDELEGYAEQPVWSPDERWIAYRMDTNAAHVAGSVYLQSWVSGGEPFLLGGDDFEIGEILGFSADGRWLAISGGSDTSNDRDLFVIDVSGSVPGPPIQVSPVASNQGRWVSGAGFVPGTARLVYGLADTGVLFGGINLYVADLSGATPADPVRVGPPADTTLHPTEWRWTPTGATLVYRVFREASETSELWRFDVDAPDGEARRVSGDLDGIVSAYEWALLSDGASAVIRGTESGLTRLYRFALGAAPAAPEVLSPIGLGEVAGRGMWVDERLGQPAVTADGAFAAFRAGSSETAGWSLYVLDLQDPAAEPWRVPLPTLTTPGVEGFRIVARP